MRPNKSDKTTVGKSGAWEPPAFVRLPIGKETRAAREGADPAAQAPQPQPPAGPSSKLGFSFEMAFPLSSRIGE